MIVERAKKIYLLNAIICNCIYLLLFNLFFVKNIDAITIKDLLNREIKISGKINNIIALGPGTLRLLAYMDALQFVKGVEALEKDKSMLCKRPYALINYEYIKKLPTIGNGGPNMLPDFEAIISIKSDLIFTASYTLDQIKLIQEKTNIPVVSLSYGNANAIINKEIEASLNLIGLVLNKSNRAQDLIKYINSTIMDFQERVPTNKTINIKTYIAGLGYKGSHGFTGSTPYYPPFDLLNLKNILSSFPEFSKLNHIILDKEAILLLNPDYIFIDSNGLNIIKMDIIRNKAYYRLLKAVKNNHVYSLLPHNNYTTNIENALINTYFIGKTIYPDKFSDIDLEKKANEIYQFFIGKYIFSEMQQNGIGCKRLFFDPDCIAW